MKKKEIIINWFRQDLRLDDNPSLHHASKFNIPILNIFILDEINCGKKKFGRASKYFLYHSLKNLDNLLNYKLSLFKGCAIEVFRKLEKKYDIKGVSWNRCYEPWQIIRDTKIKSFLSEQKINTKTFNGSLLWEPWNILKSDSTPYKVFTPFYKRGCLNHSTPREPLPRPILINIKDDDSVELSELNLLEKSKWYKKLDILWNINEKGLEEKVENFFNKGIKNYRDGRNFPSKKYVSRLSPFLRWGLVSPNFLWHKCKHFDSSDNISNNVDVFKSELGWREFSYYLLYHFKELPRKNLQGKFDKFPWLINKDYLNKWKLGLTGYPIVDAGMRELWKTGYMHNRLRMIVGSFLVKNLLIDWRKGEEWFWDCLLDADLASNSASWQWVAGTGADAAPYFRIFNPITQGEKFDEEGSYTKKYVPELKNLSPKYLFKPWLAPQEVLEKNGIELGKNYPYPIVDIKISRTKALEAFSSIKVTK